MTISESRMRANMSTEFFPISVHQLSAFLREFASWWDQDCDASSVNMKDQSRQFREAADALDQLTRPVDTDAALFWQILQQFELRLGNESCVKAIEERDRRLTFASAHAEQRGDKAEADLSASQAALSELLEMYKTVTDAKDKAEQEVAELKARIAELEKCTHPHLYGMVSGTEPTMLTCQKCGQLIQWPKP